MSRLEFSRAQHSITLFDSEGNRLGSWEAYNNPSSTSSPFPSGTYPFSWHSPHTGAAANSEVGAHGNFIFVVPGHPGMGVHAGRAGPQSVTGGCIRTTDGAMQRIQDLHRTDRLTQITVQ